MMGKNSCDMWSLGIILYELIYEKHPLILDDDGRVNDKFLKKFVNGTVQIKFPKTNEKYPI